jgi:hypothetical protein
MDDLNYNNEESLPERAVDAGRQFYVCAPSTNAVRKALHRAPGGARVVGRHDRATIQCTHTMDEHSLGRHWPVIVSRLGKAGLAVVPRPATKTSAQARAKESD